MLCAVCGCSNNYKLKKEKISYFSFPTDPELLKKWVQFCKRKKTFNTSITRICSDHFRAEDLETNMQIEIGFIIRNHRKLKPGSVPSVYNEINTTVSRFKMRRAKKINNSVSNHPPTSNETEETSSSSSTSSVPSVYTETHPAVSRFKRRKDKRITNSASTDSSSNTPVPSVCTETKASSSRFKKRKDKKKNDSSSKTVRWQESNSPSSSTSSVPSVCAETAPSTSRGKRRKNEKVTHSDSNDSSSDSSGVQEQESTDSEDTCIGLDTDEHADKNKKCEQCGIIKSQLDELNTAIDNLDEGSRQLKQMQEVLQEQIKCLQLRVQQNPFIELPEFKKRKTKHKTKKRVFFTK